MTGLATVLAVAALSGADSLFAEANRAYEAGEYGVAAATYQEILEGGLECPEVQFNLANAQYRLGALGKAILAYRRCLRLAPRDSEARRNLALARARVGNEPERSPILSRVATAVLEAFSSGELTYALLLIYWAAGIAGLCHLIRRGRWTRATLLSLLALAVPVLILWWGRLAFERKPLAVLVETAAARSGPGTDYRLQFTAGEGTEVVVEKREHGWHLVRVPQGPRGWVEADKLERW